MVFMTDMTELTINNYNIMEINTYEAPQVRVVIVRTGSIFLASGEKMRTVAGSWDEDE